MVDVLNTIVDTFAVYGQHDSPLRDVAVDLSGGASVMGSQGDSFTGELSMSPGYSLAINSGSASYRYRHY